MTKTEKAFFELLRCAIWQKDATLPEPLSPEEWQQLFKISKEQTVAGILMDAVATLPDQQKPPIQLRMQWIIMLKMIEQQNRRMNAELTRTTQELESNGIKYHLLKGQGVAANYPTPLHRACGDIDILFPEEDFPRALDFFCKKGCQIEDHSIDTHAETIYNGILWELHLKSAIFFYPNSQKKYNNIIPKQIKSQPQTRVTINEHRVTTLPHIANALQLLVHMQRHILVSGLGLRQLCDWVLFVYNNHEKINRQEFIQLIEELNLTNTYKAITYLSINYLGLPKEYAMLPLDNAATRNSKRILWIIMQYGNFGHYGEHSKITSKWSYIRLFFWKLRNVIRFYKMTKYEAVCYPFDRILKKYMLYKEAHT